MLSRRHFIQTAAAMGAAFAWGGPARASRTRWSERRDLFPEGVASGDPDPGSVILWTRRPYELGDRHLLTVEVAEEQAQLLRKGIGDIFINLARRNQTLLDRQIEFIDQLEANEEDPDQLDNLFKLDHLATRMRRNAESLLVLAGATRTAARSSDRPARRGTPESSRRTARRRPVPRWPSPGRLDRIL